jgi:hypothetical protein
VAQDCKSLDINELEVMLKRLRGRPRKYNNAEALRDRRERLKRAFEGMADDAFTIILSGDEHRIEEALKATCFSDFLDRAAALATIVARATGEEGFPRRYRESQAKYLADAIIASDADSSVRYLRRVYTRLALTSQGDDSAAP